MARVPKALLLFRLTVVIFDEKRFLTASVKEGWLFGHQGWPDPPYVVWLGAAVHCSGRKLCSRMHADARIPFQFEHHWRQLTPSLTLL